MPNSKLNPRYNVVSLRISDEEKAALEEVSQRTRKSLSRVVREAIQLYSRDVTLLSSGSRFPV
jgi:predicted DNA-binding protein